MPPSVFHVGEAVRMMDGPFVSFVGVVRAVAKTPEGEIVTVGVGLQGRETPVKLAVDQPERIR